MLRIQAATETYRKSQRALGLCTACPAPAAKTSTWYCDRHLEKRGFYRQRAAARKGRGMPGRRVGGTGMGVRVEHTMVPGPRL